MFFKPQFADLRSSLSFANVQKTPATYSFTKIYIIEKTRVTGGIALELILRLLSGNNNDWVYQINITALST